MNQTQNADGSTTKVPLTFENVMSKIKGNGPVQSTTTRVVKTHELPLAVRMKLAKKYGGDILK